MTDLSVNYAGLKLKNPLIVGSSGLTNSIENIKKFAKYGASAVVLKSIFEEEITLEYDRVLQEAEEAGYHAENLDYFDFKIKEENVGNYIKLIKEAKSAVEIPIIASVNCISAHEWTYFATEIEKAGADALELNIFTLPSDLTKSSHEIEGNYFEVVNKITDLLTIPVTLKMSYFSAGLGNLIIRLSETKLKGIVLFNRFFQPDIDLENRKIIPAHIFSAPAEIATPLRWSAILSDKMSCSLAASTGVHDAKGMIKLLLAGADAVQIASVLYNKGAEEIENILDQLSGFMEDNKYTKIADFKGSMSKFKADDVALYERVQFMRYFNKTNIPK